MSNSYVLAAYAVMMLGTMLTRFAASILFKEKTPEIILYLGNKLPEAAIAMIIIYCFKSVNFLGGNHGIPEIISTLVVVGLHKWKHNTLLSILGGTLLYMALVQFVFVI